MGRDRLTRWIVEPIVGYLGVVWAVGHYFRPARTWQGALWAPCWIVLVVGVVALGPIWLPAMAVFQRRVPRD